MYGAGMIPSISTNSANFSGVHLKESLVAALGSRQTTQLIFFAMRNSRSFSHWMSSVVWGSERQNSRTHSMCEGMTANYSGLCPYQQDHGVSELVLKAGAGHCP